METAGVVRVAGGGSLLRARLRIEERCRCPDGADWHFPGWPWCRPCGEHHRGEECDIDEDGTPRLDREDPGDTGWPSVET